MQTPGTHLHSIQCSSYNAARTVQEGFEEVLLHHRFHCPLLGRAVCVEELIVLLSFCFMAWFACEEIE
jgi:hypothetical protein